MDSEREEMLNGKDIEPLIQVWNASSNKKLKKQQQAKHPLVIEEKAAKKLINFNICNFNEKRA